VAFSPRELKLVTAGDDSEVRIWDLTKKACIATLKVSDMFPTVCSHSVRSAAALVTTALLRDLCAIYETRFRQLTPASITKVQIRWRAPVVLAQKCRSGALALTN